MKLVIKTQIHENYGAHAWDGEGECPQYWKPKGGEIYVLEGLSPEEAQDMSTNPNGRKDHGWLVTSRFAHLTDRSSDYYEEYVIDWCFADDDEMLWEPWEQPLFIEKSDNEWVARRREIDRRALAAMYV